jgi:hypothetical protein
MVRPIFGVPCLEPVISTLSRCSGSGRQLYVETYPDWIMKRETKRSINKKQWMRSTEFAVCNPTQRPQIDSDIRWTNAQHRNYPDAGSVLKPFSGLQISTPSGRSNPCRSSTRQGIDAVLCETTEQAISSHGIHA